MGRPGGRYWDTIDQSEALTKKDISIIIDRHDVLSTSYPPNFVPTRMQCN